MCCSCWIFKPRNYDAWNRPSTTSPRYAPQQIRYLCMGFESSAKKVNSDFSSLIAALSIKWTKIGFSSLDKSYSSKMPQSAIIQCHNTKLHNGTFMYYKDWQIWRGHGSCWSCQSSTVPHQSRLLHQQSSLSPSLFLCVRFMRPPCLSAIECPVPSLCASLSLSEWSETLTPAL